MNTECTLRLDRLSRKSRKEKLVLFFGREHFSDNTKYLYLKTLEENPDFTCLWCSTDKALIDSLKANNLPCFLIEEPHQDEAIRLFLSAAVAVFSVNPSQSLNGSEELFACLAGAKQLQLWHGVSVKHLLLKLAKHLSLTDYDFRRPVDFASRADAVLSTASCLDDFFSESFGCKRLIRAGYPRNEVILRQATSSELIGSTLPPEMAKALNDPSARKVLFTPTWQRGESQLLTSGTEFISYLAQVCQRNNASLFIKSHPLYQFSKESSKLAGNVWFINPAVDIYPWLNRFDALITDYSSIMFDFLITQKPILRLELDRASHRSYEPDFSLIPPGEFAYRFTKETLPALLAQALDADVKAAERREMRDALFETDPLQSSASLIRLLCQEVAATVGNSRQFNVETY